MIPIKLYPPTPLRPDRQFDDFDSGVSILNDWLRKRVLNNQAHGVSHTYVVCGENNVVVGYYCISAGAVSHEQTTGALCRNIPDPISIVVMGRLAVHQRYQHLGVGRGMLKDALLHTIQASEVIGIKALLVHAISEDAKNFYLTNGFIESPTQPLTLFLALDKARKVIVDG